MINWMRNHASPAHDSDTRVEYVDVIALAQMLASNLFSEPIPDPGHSPQGLFEPAKTAALDEENLALFRDQIKSYNNADLRITFGFMVDLLCLGEEPALTNIRSLLPTAWDRANEDLRKSAGARYHSFLLNSDSDESPDQGAKVRLLEFLIAVGGIKYIPDAAPASLCRQAAKQLGAAKDSDYGWASEAGAARSLSN